MGLAEFLDERVECDVGEMGLCRRHEGEWLGIMEVQSLNLAISDAALTASRDGIWLFFA